MHEGVQGRQLLLKGGVCGSHPLFYLPAWGAGSLRFPRPSYWLFPLVFLVFAFYAPLQPFLLPGLVAAGAAGAARRLLLLARVHHDVAIGRDDARATLHGHHVAVRSDVTAWKVGEHLSFLADKIF